MYAFISNKNQVVERFIGTGSTQLLIFSEFADATRKLIVKQHLNGVSTPITNYTKRFGEGKRVSLYDCTQSWSGVYHTTRSMDLVPGVGSSWSLPTTNVYQYVYFRFNRKRFINKLYAFANLNGGSTQYLFEYTKDDVNWTSWGSGTGTGSNFEVLAYPNNIYMQGVGILARRTAAVSRTFTLFELEICETDFSTVRGITGTFTNGAEVFVTYSRKG